MDYSKNRKYLVPFVLVTSLFFLWGFAHSILDVLNKHFQEILGISKTESGFIQAVVYGGYFLMALPAGEIIRRFGYRAGVITGLLLYGIGALLFIPGSRIMTFGFFLFSLFVIGCGLTCLETAANPYVTVLGDREGAERRINLSQSFNGLGWIFGPMVGGLFLFGEGSSNESIAIPYAIIGVIVLVVALVFSRVRLPEVEAEGDGPADGVGTNRPLWKHGGFVFGLVALFFYVAAQTGINSFFINYVTENSCIDKLTASQILAFGGMVLFMAGRVAGSLMMRRIRSAVLLAVCGFGAIVTMIIVSAGTGMPAIVALLLCYLFESIMFPTIFALALKGLGEHTKRASSYLIMSIVGGAIAPPLMGLIADNSSMRIAFVLPAICFAVVAAYAMKTVAVRK